MEYWVDGYNLILRAGRDRGVSLEAARARLIRETAALNVPVRLYFDASKGDGGPNVGRGSGKVAVVFVRKGTADDAIAADLRAARKGETVVVTDDRELRGRAKQLGAATVGVDKFLKRPDLAVSPVVTKPAPTSRAKDLGADPDVRDARPSAREVDEWMKIFGFDEPDAPKA
jgi:predicted RNA-binding protein with PIN domain